MLTTIVLTIALLALLVLLASGLWATVWPWIYFVRPDDPVGPDAAEDSDYDFYNRPLP